MLFTFVPSEENEPLKFSVKVSYCCVLHRVDHPVVVSVRAGLRKSLMCQLREDILDHIVTYSECNVF